MFGLTRSIGGWEEGERRKRNKQKRQPGRTGAGQRGEWQLNEQREEIHTDVEERERLNFLLFVCMYLFALSVQLPFSSLSCAGSSWLPLLLVSFPSFSLLPTPNRPCLSERSSKARHEADSFDPAEWSERLTPGQSGWLLAAAVGLIPVLALSLFLQRRK